MRLVRPMLGFNSMRCTRILLVGVETMHMIRQGQPTNPDGLVASASEQFYSLAY